MMLTAFRPERLLSSSPVKWPDEPLVDTAIDRPWGMDLASAFSSSTVLIPSFGLATRTLGMDSTWITGAMSSDLYGSFSCSV